MILSPMTIDTIDMTVGVGKTLFKELWPHIYGLGEPDDGCWPLGWKVSAKCVSSSLRLLITPGKKRTIAVLEIGTSKHKQHWFKLTLFPNNFRGIEFELLQDHLLALLPDFNYAKLFHSARVTRIDLAIDCYSVSMGEVIPYRKLTRTSRRWIGKEGLGTLYLGSPRSALWFRVYDKKKQLVQKKGVAIKWSKMVRFEAVVRKVGCPASHLLEALPDPFEGLWIVPKGAAKALKPDDTAWGAFLVVSDAIGSASALGQVPYAARRKKYREDVVGIGTKLFHAKPWVEALAHAIKRILPKEWADAVNATVGASPAKGS